MEIEKLRNRIKKNKAGYIILCIFSFIYYFFFKIKKTLYKTKILRSVKFSKLVICIGNISSGGTGKTTFIISLSKKLIENKINFCITMRGYKSGYGHNYVVDSYKINNFLEDEKISDEQKVFYTFLNKYNIPLIACKNRKKAIDYAISNYNPDLVMMDDGLQNFSINKDLSVCIVSINQLNDKLLPLGNLREKYKSLKDFDFIVLNHCELFVKDEIENALRFINKFAPEDKIIKAWYEVVCFVDIINNLVLSKEDFKKIYKDIVIFSGLGDNKQFKEIIKRNSFNIVQFWEYPDHHRYGAEEIFSMAELSNNLPVITTYKDIVKCYGLAKKLFKKLYVVETELKMENDNILNKIVELVKR